jgi:hypothetical protein
MADRSIYRSQNLAFAASSSAPIPLAFLEPAKQKAFGVIHEILIRIQLNLTVAMGNSFLSKLAPQILTFFRLTDRAGNRVFLRGSSMRVMNQHEFGDAYTDGANLGAGAAQAFEFYMRVSFMPSKSRRRADYGIPVRELLDGGTMEAFWSPANVFGANVTINSGSIECYFEVIDERTPELKSRMTYLDYDVTLQEFYYPVTGSLRWATYYSENRDNAATPLVAQNILSNTLGLPFFPSTLFQDRHKSENWPRIGDSAATILTEDVVAAGFAIPIEICRRDQKISPLIDTASLHMKTDQAIPAAVNKMIICAIQDRNAGLAVTDMAAQSEAQLNAALSKYGYIRTAQNSDWPIAMAPKVLQKRLPLKIKLPAAQ